MPHGIPVDRLRPGQYWAAGPLYSEASRLVFIMSVCDRLDYRARILRYAEYFNRQPGWGWHGGAADLSFHLDDVLLATRDDWKLIDPKAVFWPYGTAATVERLVWRTTTTGKHLTSIKPGEEHEGDEAYGS